MLPSHLIPPPRKMLRTLGWTRPPISPLGHLLSQWVGQHGLLCHRIKSTPWDGLQTRSFLPSMTPPLAVAFTRRTLPASGPSPSHALPASHQTWTRHRCDSLLSLSLSLHLRWSRRCGTVNTSLLRTPSLLHLRGLSPRTL